MHERIGAGARIIDRGYQHYEGTRLGARYAVLAMARNAMARGLGLRRPARSKIIPMILIVLANIPVVIVLALQLLSKSANVVIPSYTELESNNLPLVFLLFAAVVGPDMYCTDRRERVLSLYFAAPITRPQYVAARVAALVILMMTVTFLPLLLLFIGDTLLASSAADYFTNHLHDLGSVVVAGILLALYFASLASVVSSFTDRRTYAAGGFVGLLLVTALPANLIAFAIDFSGHQWFVLGDLLSVGTRTARWMFGATPVSQTSDPTAQAALAISGWAFLGATLAIIVVSLALLFWRYRTVVEQ